MLSGPTTWQSSIEKPTITTRKEKGMNKVLLSILAGATMLSSVASASPALKIDATDLVLPTGDQVISDLYNQNVGGINNVSLSKYEQAWMIVHDKESIFKHKTFWVRTGKVFTGISIDDLKDLNKSERSELIVDSVKRSIIDAAIIAELNATIEMKDIKIAELDSMIKNKDITIGEHLTTISELNTKIENLEAAKDALFTAEDLTVEFNKGVASVDITTDNKTAWKDGKQHATDRAKSAGLSTGAPVGEYASVEKTIEQVYDYGVKVGNATNTADLLNALTPDSKDAAIALNEGNRRTTIAEADAKVSSASASTYTVSGVDQFVVSVNNELVHTGSFITSDIRHAFEEIASKSFDHGYADGFEAGYDAGFSDGYDAGYADGYADGFKDGVDSVTK